MHMKQNQE